MTTTIDAAIVEFRRTQIDRWHQKENSEAADAARKARAAAWNQYYRVDLIADDVSIIARAKAALEKATSLKDARDAEDLNERADHLRDVLVRDFIAAGKNQVALATPPSPEGAAR